MVNPLNMNPELISSFVNDSIPPELVTLAIVLGGLSGTFFFVWGIIAPAIRSIRDMIFQLSYREIEVHIADPDYFKFNMWLNTNHENTYFQRAYKVVSSYGSLEDYEQVPDVEDDDEPLVSTLVPGFGSVLIKAPGMPFVWVIRTKEESKQVFKQTETLKFKIFAFSQSTVTAFFKEVTKIRQDSGPRVYSSVNTYWARSGFPKNVLPPLGASSKELVEDVRKFLDEKDVYRRKGIPYKRGYMFTGAPGTGKSSIVAYLSRTFGMDVYVLNSESISKFNSLRGQIKPGSIVLVEDIDMTVAGSKRQKLLEKDGSVMAKPEDGDETITQAFASETMREFLNGLDGICEFDGSIIIVTTNNPNALDPALIRPGRIDQRFDIGAYTPTEQIEHINRFFDTTLDADDYPNMQLRTVAEVQFMCTSAMTDVDQVIKQL